MFQSSKLTLGTVVSKPRQFHLPPLCLYLSERTPQKRRRSLQYFVCMSYLYHNFLSSVSKWTHIDSAYKFNARLIFLLWLLTTEQFYSLTSKNINKHALTIVTLNSFPLTLWVKAACLVLAIEVLLHARVLTLICACPIILATINFQMQIWDISKGF